MRLGLSSFLNLSDNGVLRGTILDENRIPFGIKGLPGIFQDEPAAFENHRKVPLTFLGLTIFFELSLRKLSTRSCRFSLKSLVEFLYSRETCEMTVFMSYEMNIRLIRCYIRLSQVR